jgi:hypothetical protein
MATSYIPVVIHHLGDQLYFQKCVELNAKHNKVIVIGDSTNIKLFQHNINVQHVHIDTLMTDDVRDFEKYFVNYSSNNPTFEFLCFQRIFVLRELLKTRNLTKVVYVDSDCILLDNMTEYFNTFPDIHSAVSIVTSNSPYNMTACIHNSLLTIHFCDVFIQLCKDIYQNKSKFHLIQDKAVWHQKTRTPGGICDMTLYYLMVQHKMVTNVADLNATRIYQNELCVFDHNSCIKYGFLGDNTFQVKNDLKVIVKQGSHYYALLHNGQPIRLLSMHFQGNNKKYLETIDVNTF